MNFFMDISRDEDGDLLSVVTGCNKCATRTVTIDVQEARDWVTSHAIHYHDDTDSRKIEQVGDVPRIHEPKPKPVKIPAVRNKPAYNEILAMLEDSDGMYTHDIADERGAIFNSTYKLLQRMEKDGFLKRSKVGVKVLWEALDKPSEASEQEVPTMTAPEEVKPVERLVRPYYGDPAVIQGFGAHEEVYSRFGFKGHMGLDIAIAKQPVLAAHDGIVEYAGDGGEWPLMGAAAGNCILIGSETLRTGYAHLERWYVQIGDTVKAGDVIGISGNTGATTGFHLHFEVMPKPHAHTNGYAGRVDPTPYLPTPTEGTL